MRKILGLVAVLLFAAGCRGTQAYYPVDLKQVRTAYARIAPIYTNFKEVYGRGDTAGIRRDFKKEQAACRLVDVIDRRDTIDPNVQLFQASVELDAMCNAIESAYVWWAQKHGYPYDKSVIGYRPDEVFVGADAGLLKMPGYMRHPSALA
jgi:hypothetical protein